MYSTTDFIVAGKVIYDNGALRNEFLNTLVNMIGRAFVVNDLYTNHWGWTNKGMLELGDKIEEIYINIAKPYIYDANDQSFPLNANEPDVKAEFHKINYQRYYKVRVAEFMTQEAFMSIEGFGSFVRKVIENLYTSCAWDEELATKYILAKEIANGLIPAQSWSAVATPAEQATVIREYANLMDFMSSEYNKANVPTWTPAERKHIIMTAGFRASQDVNVLAQAFNLTYADFAQKTNTVNSFGFSTAELARLDELFTDENGNYVDGYEPITVSENTALASVPCVVLDEDFFQIYDAIIGLEYYDAFNPQNLNRYGFLHIWRILSTSPYHNVMVFLSGTNGLSALALYALTYDGSGTVPGYKVGASAITTATVTATTVPVEYPIGVQATGSGIYPQMGNVSYNDVEIEIESSNSSVQADIDAGLIKVIPAKAFYNPITNNGQTADISKQVLPYAFVLDPSATQGGATCTVKFSYGGQDKTLTVTLGSA